MWAKMKKRSLFHFVLHLDGIPTARCNRYSVLQMESAIKNPDDREKCGLCAQIVFGYKLDEET